MRDFTADQISLNSLIREVLVLFDGDESMKAGFRDFLPPNAMEEYESSMSSLKANTSVSAFAPKLHDTVDRNAREGEEREEEEEEDEEATEVPATSAAVE